MAGGNYLCMAEVDKYYDCLNMTIKGVYTSEQLPQSRPEQLNV